MAGIADVHARVEKNLLEYSERWTAMRSHLMAGMGAAPERLPVQMRRFIPNCGWPKYIVDAMYPHWEQASCIDGTVLGWYVAVCSPYVDGMLEIRARLYSQACNHPEMLGRLAYSMDPRIREDPYAAELAKVVQDFASAIYLVKRRGEDCGQGDWSERLRNLQAAFSSVEELAKMKIEESKQRNFLMALAAASLHVSPNVKVFDWLGGNVVAAGEIKAPGYYQMRKKNPSMVSKLKTLKTAMCSVLQVLLNSDEETDLGEIERLTKGDLQRHLKVMHAAALLAKKAM